MDQAQPDYAVVDPIVLVVRRVKGETVQKRLRRISHQEAAANCLQHVHIVVIVPKGSRSFYGELPKRAGPADCGSLTDARRHNLQQKIRGANNGIGREFRFQPLL